MSSELKTKNPFKGKEILPELKLRYIVSLIKNVCLDSTEKVVDLLREIFDDDTFLLQEEIVVLLIDEDERPIGFSRLAKGVKEAVMFSAFDIFRLLYLSGASSFITAHNHPNGSEYPSMADIQITFDLKPKVNFLGFEYADNVILTKDSYYSFKEKEMFWEYG